MSDRLTVEEARGIVQEAKAEDKVVSISNVGANPHLRYTPYRNHRGVVCDLWSIVTLSFKAMPGRTLLTRPTVVWPDEEWEINYPTTEWLVAEIHNRHPAKINLLDPDESPTRVMGGWDR